MSLVTPTIFSQGKETSPAHPLLAIDITREVNRIPSAQVLLLDGDISEKKWQLSDMADFEPGKEIELKLRSEAYEGREVTAFKGLVMRHGIEMDDNGTSYLVVEAKDAAVKLTSPRQSVVFRDMSDADIVGKILGAAGLKKGKIEATQPKHEELVQYNATNWDFILSRAEIQGLVVSANDGEISLNKLEPNGQAKYKFAFGLEEIYNLEIEANASHQDPEVLSVAWNLKQQKLTAASKAKAFKLSQGNLDGKSIGSTVGFEATTLAHTVPLDPKELQAWADACMAKSRLALIRGRLGVPGIPDVELLDVIELTGVGKRFSGKTVVTGIRHRIDENGWRTDLQFGLAPDWFASKANVRAAPAAGLLPPVSGLQIGVVANFEEDPQKEFRVKVFLPAIDEKEAVWARLATPDAGKDRGYFFRPETGDEVVVGFFNNDPRQAVVVGSMYGSKNAPPADVSMLTADNFKKAIVTKTGTTIGLDDEKPSVSIATLSQKIRLDGDKEETEITDKHGNSITMSKDGIEVKSAKDLIIDASGKIEIKGQKVDVK